MSDNAKTLVPRGKTYYAGGTASATQGKTKGLLGQTARFKDTDPGYNAARDSRSTYNPSHPTLSGMWCHAVFVKNTSGTTLRAGQPVIWKAGQYGLEVDDGVAAKDEIAGFVDDHIVGNVADDDCFWCFYKGPQYVVVADGATIAEGDALHTAAVADSSDLDGVLTVDETGTQDDGTIMGLARAEVGIAAEAKVASSGVLKIRALLDVKNGLG